MASEFDIDSRAFKLPEHAQDCRAAGRHLTGSIRVLLRDELRHNKQLLNLSEVTIEQPCLNACGVIVKTTYNTWTGETISRVLDYKGAEGYLMAPGTGRLLSSDARAAIMADLFGRNADGSTRRRRRR